MSFTMHLDIHYVYIDNIYIKYMYLDLEPWYINKVGRYIEITIEPR
jgi:hypothetical protein